MVTYTLADEDSGDAVPESSGVTNVSFDLEGMDLESSVDEGDRIPLSFVLQNDATTVSSLDPDYCIAGPAAGYSVVVEVYIDGEQTVEFLDCVPPSGTTRDDTLPPLDDGTYNVELRIVGQNTGEVVDTYTEILTVTLDSDDGGDDGGSTDGDVTIPSQVQSPSEVPIGEQFTVTVPIQNDRSRVSLGDQDHCSAAVGVSGLNVAVDVTAGGTNVGGTLACVGLLGNQVVDVEVDGAAAGQQEMTVSLTGAVSGEEFDSQTFTVTGVQPDDGGDGDGNGDGGGDQNGDECEPPSDGCPDGEVFSYDKCSCVPEGDASWWEQRSQTEKAAIVGGGGLLAYSLFSG